MPLSRANPSAMTIAQRSFPDGLLPSRTFSRTSCSRAFITDLTFPGGPRYDTSYVRPLLPFAR
jgi:hypothetical protein